MRPPTATRARPAGCSEQLLDEDPAQPDAIGGLARCLIAERKFPEARQLLDEAPKEIASHVAVTGAKAALTLAEEAGVLGDPAELAARVEADAGRSRRPLPPGHRAVPARPGRRPRWSI